MTTGARVQGPRLIVALDYADPAEALSMAGRLDPSRCRVKVGKELFTRGGPSLVRTLVDGGHDVFLDLKFHDIPNTVAGACRAAADLGVWMVNVHASGGPAMLAAAREALPAGGPLLIAVTVLTSLTEADLRAVGVEAAPESQVLRLAGLARDAGLDGVVCSAREAVALRNAFGFDFRLVTPGVRPSGGASDDQRRVMTPADAIRAGADYLVVGRPVTKSDRPEDVLLTLESEIAPVLSA
ncbi:MAG: orotidine-5'-phosphate decarboxylase [Gammaproteobacteria bacterium]|nr:orotidine-5'-phosphate decarboxylase [Gammaproteobacteria bacterium]